MRAIILAAGFGTRFKPITCELPKPMIPVANRPLIGWAVEASLASGIRDFVINLHHLPKPIEHYLRGEYARRASFEFSLEETILGTGGALRRMRHLLTEDFVVMNGDTIQTPPLRDLVRLRADTGAFAALLLRHAPEGESFTRVWLDDGWINGFGEGEGESLMFAGCHAMHPSILDRLPERDFSGLTEDVYLPSTRRGERAIAGLIHDGLWFDVGTPARYMEASRGVLHAIREGSLVPPAGSALATGGSLADGTARLEGDASGSVIGARSHIAKTARIEGTIVWNDVRIDQGAVVENSIVGHGVLIPAHTLIRNALVTRRLSEVDYGSETTLRDDWALRSVDPEQPLVVE
jgi:NDP-sugar pyrophosphorylase family protein